MSDPRTTGPFPPLRVRPAAPEDAPVIARILAEAFAEFRSLYTDAAFFTTTPDSVEVAARLQHGPTWIALRAQHAAHVDQADQADRVNQVEQPVGTVSGLIAPDALYIRSMAVVPAGRGLGVGLLLLEHAQQFAIAQRCPRMRLTTTSFLSRAIHLYERFGFRRCGIADLHGTPLYQMEKTLTSHRNTTS